METQPRNSIGVAAVAGGLGGVERQRLGVLVVVRNVGLRTCSRRGRSGGLGTVSRKGGSRNGRQEGVWRRGGRVGGGGGRGDVASVGAKKTMRNTMEEVLHGG